MITIVKSPALNRVILDANNTEIVIQSTNGAGFYFRAIIYVNDELFDEQGWSRKDDYVASKDLVKLYNAYFESAISTFSENGLTEQTHLKKKILIVIQERSLSTDEIVETVNLPVFYLMYNTTPFYFDDYTKINLLGIIAPVILVPNWGKIVMPFYVKNTSDILTVVLKDNFGNVIHSQSIDPFNDKRIYLYAFDLTPVVLIKDTLYFELKVICGSSEQSKIYKLIRFPDFPVKEIYFKNNFGYYLPAYFDGELEIQGAFSDETYSQADGTSVTFEINEEATYTLNTGSLLQNERVIVNQIANSLEILFKVNNQYRKIQSKTKKIVEYRDKKHQYAQDLVFSFVKNGSISNYYESSEGADWDNKDFLPLDWLT
ncbi:hypothetical protein [Flavobacterium sp. F52]|uniref:hypothetical protein n=1 Tax=Flavobacterium sp. F52 TaxID=1202532 RepID=UPI000272DFE3|nr:hypothetical protein [Flavobacterium sp. F52]EJG02299.1 hypothetical protein FF52_06450 [Flavobacterium sp. F52]